MNIYRQELKMLRGSFIVWMLSLLALATIYLSIYPSFAHDTKTITDLFARMPEGYRNIFGAGGFSIFTFLGFIANVLSILLLAGAVQAMNMGISLANRERLAQTTDFLIAKPVSRSRIFAQKLGAHLTVLSLTSMTLIGYVYAGSQLAGAGDFSLTTFLMIMAIFTGIQLWFLSVGMLVSALKGRIRAVVGVSMATVFGLFVLGLFGSAVNDTLIRMISPFKYVDLVEVITTQRYDMAYIWLWAGVVVGGIAVSWLLYRGKDIHA